MQPITHGDSYQQALENALDVMEEPILHFQAEGKLLPEAKLVSV